MAAKEADVNGSESVVEVVLLDDNGSESHADDGGIASCFSSAASFYVFRAIPPFLQKLYEMLGNDEFSPVVSWSWNGTSFVIKDPHSFVADVLPLYYRHNNFQSFISQLHSYGFKKASWEQCEYKNEYFVKGQRNLLRNIKRRDYYAKVSLQPCSNTNRSATTSNELTNFKRKHDEIEAEIIKLKERQLSLEQHLASLRNRTRSNEEDSTRMMIVAQKILEKGISRSNDGLPMLEEESGETEQRKGKRKIEVEEDGGDRAKDLPDAFFSMEELCGGPMEWVKYVKEWPESSSFNPKS